eukprot:15179105-Heterocapsa_arctica.AAC.1
MTPESRPAGEPEARIQEGGVREEHPARVKVGLFLEASHGLAVRCLSSECLGELLKLQSA